MGSIFGSIIKGTTDLVTAAANNATQYKIAKDTNEMNRDNMREQMQWQSGESELNRGFNAEQAQLGREFQSSEAEKAYQRQLEYTGMLNQYNSPIEQVKRIREAGLNPSIVLSGHGVSSASGESVPSAGPASSASASGSGVSANLPVMQKPDISFPNIANGILDGLKSIAEINAIRSGTRKTDTETDQLTRSFEERMRGLTLTNDAQEDINNLRRAFEPFERKLGLSDKWASIENLQASAYKLAKEGKLDEALEQQALANKELLDATKSLRGSEKALVDEQVKSYDELTRANIRKIYSEVDVNTSQVNYTREEVLNSQQKRLEIISNALSSWEDYQKAHLSDEQMKLFREKAEKKLASEVRRGSLDNWWNPITIISAILHPLAEEVGIALGASVGASASKIKKP